MKAKNKIDRTEDGLLYIIIDGLEEKVIFDSEDILKIKLYNWSVYTLKGKYRYIIASENNKREGKWNCKKILLNRYLLGISEKGRSVKHVNGNAFDFRKDNLRVC